MALARAPRSGGVDELEIDVPNLPLIEPGTYQLAYVSHRTCYLFGNAPKLSLRFRIVSLGKAHGIELERHYNVAKLIGKPGKGGKFYPKRHGDFLLEYFTLFPNATARLDRITLLPFKSCIVTGKVVTVTKNAKQKALPQQLRYSTISELLTVGA